MALSTTHPFWECHLSTDDFFRISTVVYVILSIFLGGLVISFSLDGVIKKTRWKEMWNSSVSSATISITLDSVTASSVPIIKGIMQLQGLLLRTMRRWVPNNTTARFFAREASFSEDGKITSIPPGLRNIDNSCYQNVVIQSLASLRPFEDFLKKVDLCEHRHQANSVVKRLLATICTLNEPSSRNKSLWIPSELKTMNSWQQQDAQEYFSKILDEIEKDLMFDYSSYCCIGLEQIGLLSKNLILPEESTNANKAASQNVSSGHILNPFMTDNSAKQLPMSGLLAQRVGCSECNFTEGLSFVPFNHITVPLGRGYIYDIRDCLSQFTGLDEIDQVVCVKCTLLQKEDQLKRVIKKTILEDSRSKGQVSSIIGLITDRLKIIENAISFSGYSESTLIRKCKIPRAEWITRVKTRQAVIARPPQVLAIHINRSIFDEYSGSQLKNYAKVQYPLYINLNPWILGQVSEYKNETGNLEIWSMDPKTSLLANKTHGGRGRSYKLQAVISHVGGHENGHYICFRKYPREVSKLRSETFDADREAASNWWRISDEDVSSVKEAVVVNQDDAFMLFYEYEKICEEQPAANLTKVEVNVIKNENGKIS